MLNVMLVLLLYVRPSYMFVSTGGNRAYDLHAAFFGFVSSLLSSRSTSGGVTMAARALSFFRHRSLATRFLGFPENVQLLYCHALR